MIIKFLRQIAFMILGLSVITLYSCNDDEELTPTPLPTGNSMTYALNDVGIGISGTVVFTELDDNSTTVTVQLSNTPAGGVHPAHIHVNSAAEGGAIAVSLESINGTTGASVTNITALNDGTAITYSQLIAFDGYVNVHLSADALGTIVAQGDIGINALTGESMTYDLGARAVPGISGTATFAKRVSGETLVTVQLSNTPDGGVHPAHIHVNTALEGGGIAVSLNSIDGTTGKSATNIAKLNDDTAITYDELIAFDGYINVHLSADALGTIVAQGDIGGNALTGNMTEYALNESAVPGISGTVKFEERTDGTTLVTIMLQGTPSGGSHPAHIHNNSAAEGGTIAVGLMSVNGDTGMSMTNITALGDGTMVTYSDLIAFDGYINVHLSAGDLGTIVAQGDIGSNG